MPDRGSSSGRVFVGRIDPGSDPEADPPKPRAGGAGLPRLSALVAAGIVLAALPSARAAKEAAVIVGGDRAFPPHQFVADGEATGFDVAVARAALEIAGLEHRFELGRWASVVDRLAGGEIAMVAGMSRSPRRAERFRFSTPFARLRFVAFVRADSSLTALPALRTGTLLVQRGGVVVSELRRRFPAGHLVRVDTVRRALEKLGRGEADAAVVPELQARYLIRENGLEALRAIEPALTDRPYGFAVAKERGALLRRLEEALAVLRESGRLRELRERWFGGLAAPAWWQRPMPYVWGVGALFVLLVLVAGWVISLRKQVAARTRELAQSEQRFRKLVENALVGVYIVQDGVFTYVNQRFAELTGYPWEELVGRLGPLDLVHEEDHRKAEDRIRRRIAGETGAVRYQARAVRRDGTVIEVEVLGARIDMEGRPAIIGTMLDLTEQRQYEAEIERLAHYDPLTELPNRRLLRERASEVLDDKAANDFPVAVLYLDLDGFKEINDTRGHGTGDELLRRLAAEVRSGLGENDLASRLGGDEFAVLADDTDGRSESLARRLLEAIQQPFEVEGRSIAVGGSVGIARFPAHGGCLSELIANAESAMYEAKSAGGGHLVFRASHRARTERMLRMERALAHGRLAEQVAMHYQPRVDLHTREIVGLEALGRWFHPEWGEIGPSTFVPIVERAGRTRELRDHVLATVCGQIRVWREMGSRIPVAINLSAAELAPETLGDAIRRALAGSELDGEGLEVEITESVAMREMEREGKGLKAMRDLGIVVVLDDFGAGYSSLKQLGRLPLSAVKVDRTLVRPIGTAEETDHHGTIIRTVCALAGSLGVPVVAEGVEQPDGARRLRELGCHQAQGWCFAAAAPADVATGWIRHGRIEAPAKAAHPAHER